MGDLPDTEDPWGHSADGVNVGFAHLHSESNNTAHESAGSLAKLLVDSTQTAGFSFSGVIYATPKHPDDREKYTTPFAFSKVRGEEASSLLWQSLEKHEKIELVQLHSHNIAGVNKAQSVRNEVERDAKRKDQEDFDRERVFAKAAKYTTREV
jgi:hypothetical protein